MAIIIDSILWAIKIVILTFSWSKLLSYIWSDGAPVNLLSGDKLKDRDRSLIKERFAVSTQKYYNI